MSIWLILESGLSGPEAVSTTSIPVIPKLMEAQMNTRVAILCILISIANVNRLPFAVKSQESAALNNKEQLLVSRPHSSLKN